MLTSAFRPYSITTRIKTQPPASFCKTGGLLDPIPLQQGLRLMSISFVFPLALLDPIPLQQGLRRPQQIVLNSYLLFF